jgi:hypothetical protein
MLPQNTWVQFNVPPIKGTGRVCGVANNGVPGIGIGYIIDIYSIEDDKGPVSYTTYSHMVVFESQVTPAPDPNHKAVKKSEGIFETLKEIKAQQAEMIKKVQDSIDTLEEVESLRQERDWLENQLRDKTGGSLGRAGEP